MVFVAVSGYTAAAALAGAATVLEVTKAGRAVMEAWSPKEQVTGFAKLGLGTKMVNFNRILIGFIGFDGIHKGIW